MRRQLDQALVWVILGSFLSFSIFLPLSHVCLNQISHIQQASESCSATNAQGSDLRLPTLVAIHKDDFCQACLLGQNLLLDCGAIELTVTRAPSSALTIIYAPVFAAPEFFRSALKRAPPAGL